MFLSAVVPYFAAKNLATENKVRHCMHPVYQITIKT